MGLDSLGKSRPNLREKCHFRRTCRRNSLQEGFFDKLSACPGREQALLFLWTGKNQGMRKNRLPFSRVAAAHSSGEMPLMSASFSQT